LAETAKAPPETWARCAITGLGGMRDLQHGLEVVAKLVEVLAGTE
jgi:hypothetical protein